VTWREQYLAGPGRRRSGGSRRWTSAAAPARGVFENKCSTNHVESTNIIYASVWHVNSHPRWFMLRYRFDSFSMTLLAGVKWQEVVRALQLTVGRCWTTVSTPVLNSPSICALGLTDRETLRSACTRRHQDYALDPLRLKPLYDETLSNPACNFNLCRYITGIHTRPKAARLDGLFLAGCDGLSRGKVVRVNIRV